MAPLDLTPMQITALEILRMTAHTELTHTELRVALAAHKFPLPMPRFNRLINSLADMHHILALPKSIRTSTRGRKHNYSRRLYYRITLGGLAALTALRKLSQSQ